MNRIFAIGDCAAGHNNANSVRSRYDGCGFPLPLQVSEIIDIGVAVILDADLAA